MDYMSKMIGQRIRHLRELKEWTQVDLASKAGISRSYISELENGNKIPSVEAIRSIAAAFDVPTDMFLDDTGWVKEEDSKYLPLQDIAHHFPGDIQKFLRQQDSLAYMKMNIKMKDLQITPEMIEQVINAIVAARTVEMSQKKS